MKRRNKGQITVYVCAMLLAFLILLVTVLQGIRIREGKGKCVQAVSGAVDSIKGDYQPDLFRRYHLFALDRTYYGRGEGYLEERMIEYLDFNLNPRQSLYEYQVKEVALTDTVSLTDQHLSGFRKQIQSYMELKMPVNVVQELIDMSEVEALEQQEQEIITEWDGWTNGARKNKPTLIKDVSVIPLNPEDYLDLLNPLTFMGNSMNDGILYIVMPEQAGSVSREVQDLSQVPSSGIRSDVWDNPFSGLAWKQMGEWNRLGEWKADEQFSSGLCESIEVPDWYGVAYAMDSFQYAGAPLEDGEYHSLDYEVEYLIVGKESDYANMTEVAERICLMRFISNGVYSFSNETMKQEATVLAAVILAPFGLGEAAEPMSYVLLACWTYGESLLDVKALLNGESVPIVKDEETWQLSLSGLCNASFQEESNGKSGVPGDLDYRSYLLLLLAMTENKDILYYRMMDIMQWNIQNEIPEFRMNNCICEFQLQTEIIQGDYVWYIEAEGVYE